MNRQILFRGKRVIDGKWVESCCPLGEMHSGTVTYDFDPKTVCQYTGLTDKNGRKIFENDKCCVGRLCVLAYGVIKYLNGCFCFVEDGTENILRLCDVRINGYEIKVDGNIYDNPELLGAGSTFGQQGNQQHEKRVIR